MSKDQIHREDADKYQELFNLLSQEHGITATCLEMQDIIHIVLKNHSPQLIDKLPKSTIDFINDCSTKLNKQTDMWEFSYKGKIVISDKSKFQCMIAQKKLQRTLNM